ncbi:MAG: glycosyltransferase [Opitutae bacterium]|nr:glycosyltransferase [Opitutae bacterium]
MALSRAFRLLYESPKSRLAGIDDLIAAMDEDGVDRSVVFGFPWRHLETARMNNDYILEAVARTGNPDFRLLVIGPVTDTLTGFLNGPHGRFIVAAGAKPAVEMNQWLGAGDLTVLPMADDLLARSQVPCKVFEAMAVGLPVLAGAVSDLPEIVEGAGETFEPGDAEELRKRLMSLWNDPGRMQAWGREARRKCTERFSLSAMERGLAAALESIAEGSGGPADRSAAGPAHGAAMSSRSLSGESGCPPA